MKIALIGPGIMPIPPLAWGAVEILIWDYSNELKKQGHDVTIINTPDANSIVSQVNDGKFDFVHLHYDVFYRLLEHFHCPRIAITSHYPYIDKPEKHAMDGYDKIFDFLKTQSKYYNFVLADKDMKAFINAGANMKYLEKIKNGIDSKLFEFLDTPIYDKTIYLGKITPRKNQAKFQRLKNVAFVGGCDDVNFYKKSKNYLGEWSREKIHKELTFFTNLLLISDGEADPLVVKEALIAGLGVVINKSSAENLNKDHDFITIVEDDKINDLHYIESKIEENKTICSCKRKIIRHYGIRNFDINIEVGNYISKINNINTF